MNEDQLNLDIRRFLKQFGITAQREIEMAVRDAIENGTLTGAETLSARAHLTVAGISLELTIEADLRLS